MTWFRNLRLTPKLIGSFILVAMLAATVGATGLVGLNTLNGNMTTITSVNVPNITYLLRTKAEVANAIRYTRGAVISTTPSQSKNFTVAQSKSFVAKGTMARDQAKRDWQTYKALPWAGTTDQVLAAQIDPIFQQWLPLDAQVGNLALRYTAAANTEAGRLSVGPEVALANPLTAGLDQLVAINQTAVTAAASNATSAYTAAKTLLLAILALAVLLAVGLGWLIARSIARPLAEVKRAASSLANVCMTGLAEGISALAKNDLTVAAHVSTTPPTYTSNDEIGETAEVVRAIIAKAQTAILAYEEARGALSGLIGQVARSSAQVNSGASQLAQATQQVGEASTQISRAIEDVARGASEQSRGATEMAQQMRSLETAIEQAAAGVDQQQATAGPVAEAMAGMRTALRASEVSLSAVTEAAAQAASTAREGGNVVARTVASIKAVRGAVLESAVQVEALGKQSSEISQIVEAIDDIAAQTNLLALNAAIEAARAGEHGKGFTVVAAEVRKLAERSSNETKEIAGRIRSIQERVTGVVAAMQTAGTAVAESAALGEQTQSTLESIVSTVEGTRQQIESILAGYQDLQRHTGALEARAAERTTIVAATAQATIAMRKGAVAVGHGIESTAAVSEQSAASAEEVSASTEEQTAGVEQMSAGAQELAALAIGLKELVERFTLDVAGIAPREAAKQKVRPSRAA